MLVYSNLSPRENPWIVDWILRKVVIVFVILEIEKPIESFEKYCHSVQPLGVRVGGPHCLSLV